MSTRRPRLRTGWTLLELSTTVAAIGLLIAMLLSAVAASRETARKTQCTNNLVQIGIAAALYVDSFGSLPSGVLNETGPIRSVPQGYHVSWTILLLPYLELDDLVDVIDRSGGVYARSNWFLVRDIRWLDAYRCPSGGTGRESSYAGCYDDREVPIDDKGHGVLFRNSHIRYDEIADGLSHTILIGEKRVSLFGDLGWPSGTRATLRNSSSSNEPTDVTFARNAGHYVTTDTPDWQDRLIDQLPQDFQLPEDPALYVGGFSSDHTKGINFLMCDGSVRSVDRCVDPIAFRTMGHRSDGAPLETPGISVSP
ncbi:DUF1559 domain-containing protein [Thermostilla marina]